MADFILPSDMPEANAAPATAGGSPAASGSSFVLPSDQEDAHSPSGGFGSSVMGLATNAAAGVNEATRGLLGLSGNAASWALSKIPGADSLGIRPGAGDRVVNTVLDPLGMNPDRIAARTLPEKMARAAGAGAASMVLPGGAVGAAERMGVAVPEVVGTMLGATDSLGGAAANAAMGAAGGGTGALAEEHAPERYKPLASLVGNIVGGGVAAGAGAAAQGAKNLGAKMLENSLISQGSQERAAGRALRDAASDPQAALEAVGSAPRELVPGSQPTLGQATGDAGLSAFENRGAAYTPALGARQAEQGQARVSNLQGVQPTGDPADTSAFFRRQLSDIDAQTQAAVDRAHVEAHSQAAQMGGTGTPEDYGSTLRSAVQDARDAASARESQLWGAIDPDGKLSLDVTPIRDAAATIQGKQSPLAKPIAGEEGDILSAINGMQPITSFNDVTALRSRLNAATSEELSNSGRTPTYARLAQLRGAVEDAISGAVERRAAQDNAAVAAGAMSPEDTLASQWQRSLEQTADEFASAKRDAGTNALSRAVGDGAALPAGVPGAYRSQGQAGGRSANSASAAGVPGDVPAPNFDQAAADRLKAASTATQDRARTFDQGSIADILKTRGQARNYALSDSGVPSRVFTPNVEGAQRVQAFRSAVGNDDNALAVLSDYAASTLRREAVGADGTLDPAKFATWQNRYQDALRAMPGLADRFTSAEAASRAVGEAAVARRQAMDAYQAGTVGKILRLGDTAVPSDVTRTVGGIFGRDDAAMQMRRLVTEASKDPDALAGLRKAVADHMLDRFVTEGAPDPVRAKAFQHFIATNELVLKTVFDGPQIDRMRATAMDMQRSATAAAAKGRPGGQAGKVLKAMETAAEPKASMLGALLDAAKDSAPTAGVALFAGHPLAAIGALGQGAARALGGSLRDSGLAKVSDLVREAWLNPELGAALMLKATPHVTSPAMGAHVGLKPQLARLSMFAGGQGAAQTAGYDRTKPSPPMSLGMGFARGGGVEERVYNFTAMPAAPNSGFGSPYVYDPYSAALPSPYRASAFHGPTPSPGGGALGSL